MPMFNVRLAPNPTIGAADCILLGRVQVSQSAIRGNAIVFRRLEPMEAVMFPCAADRGPVPVSEIMFRLMTYSQEGGRTETCVVVANREEADTIPGFMVATVLRSDNFTITVANAPELTATQQAEIEQNISRIMARRMVEDFERRLIDEGFDPSLTEPDKKPPPKPRTAPNCLRLMRRAVDII